MTTAAETRQPGYYWAKDSEGWSISQWVTGPRGGYWLSCGDERGWGDEVWDEIDERPIQRQP